MRKAKFYYKDESAPKPNKPNHIGVAVMIEYNDQILLEQRVDSNRWAFIGGGLKIDEDLISCAIREVFEETGLSLSEDQLQFSGIYDDPSRIAEYPDGNILRIITSVYWVELTTRPLSNRSSESRALKFFSKDELKQLEIAETHIPIMQSYVNLKYKC